MTQPDSSTPIDVQVRPATDEHIAAITAIYAHHVRHGAATFEIEPPSKAEMAQRRQEIVARGLPYLVAERDHVTVGYAYAGPYRPRPAYRFTVEDSIYLHPDFLGQGVGRLLLDQLIEQCIVRGCRQMVAVIGDRSAAPVRLHERFHFRTVGVLEAVGFKLGRWVDTVLMQRALGPGSTTLPQ